MPQFRTMLIAIEKNMFNGREKNDPNHSFGKLLRRARREGWRAHGLITVREVESMLMVKGTFPKDFRVYEHLDNDRNYIGNLIDTKG